MTKEEIKKEFEKKFRYDFYGDTLEENNKNFKRDIWSFFESYLQPQPKSLEGVKKEFDKKFKKDLACDNPWKYAHPYLWDFISQQISNAEERGYKRGYEDGFNVQCNKEIRRRKRGRM